MKKKILGTFVFLLVCSIQSQLHATDTRWVGETCDLNNAVNWSSGIPNSTTNADFGASTCTAPTLSSGPAFYAHSFNFSGTSAYTFTVSNARTFGLLNGGIVLPAPPMNVTFFFNGGSQISFDSSPLSTAILNANGSTIDLIAVPRGDQAQINLTNGATLELDLNDSQIGSLSSDTLSDAIYLNSYNLTIGNLNLPSTIKASISDHSGTGSQLTKVGSAILALSGTNTYTGNTNINGGVLRISAAANIPSSGTIIFNGGQSLDTQTGVVIPNNITLTTNGTLNVDSNTTTLNGPISGSGALIKTGDGTLQLNSANHYSGGTVISAGVLKISADNQLGNSSGNITVRPPAPAISTLDIATGFSSSRNIILSGDGTAIIKVESTPVTLSGAISGAGSLTKTGSGILALSNSSNHYLGGTNIKEGTLQIAAAGNIPSSGTITFNGGQSLDVQTGSFFIPNDISLTTNGTINVPSSTITISGSIAGAGSFVKTGNGTLVLSGALSYLGTTTISAGTLEGNLASLQGAITNNGEVVFNQQKPGTYSNDIIGVGTFTKTGRETLTLLGVNTYMGNTIVSNGKLKVNGHIHSPVRVAASAALGGTGTITASGVMIEGTLNPGNSIGTLSVSSPMTTFSPSSTYLAEFNAANCDLLDVTGAVAIQPGASVALKADRVVPAGTVYPIIDATSVSGAFTTLNNPYLFITARVATSANRVLLFLSTKSFAEVLSVGAPFNAMSVGLALDRVNPLGSSDLDNIVNDLMLVTTFDELNHDLLQMQPSQLKALGVSETNRTVQLHSVIADHADSYLKTPCALENGKKWGVWGDLLGNFSHQSQRRGEMGFHDETGGSLIGVDACPVKNLCVGAAAAYTFTRLAWNQSPSTAHIQNAYGILYASWYKGHFFVTSSLTGAYDYTHANRSIILETSDTNRTARSSFSGMEGSGFVEMGGIFQYHKVQFMPFGSLHYCYVHQNDFREKGAIGLNLKVKEANANLLRSEAGLKVFYCHRVNDYEWVPKLGASVIEENRFKGKYYHAEFVEDPGVFFTVKGLHPDHTLFSPKASLQLKNGGGFSWFLGYEGEFGKKFHNNRANFFMNYSF